MAYERRERPQSFLRPELIETRERVLGKNRTNEFAQAGGGGGGRLVRTVIQAESSKRVYSTTRTHTHTHIHTYIYIYTILNGEDKGFRVP